MVREHPAEKVAPATWVIHGPLGFPSPANQGFMNNPAFVVTRDAVVIVDPGSSLQAGRMVLAQLRKVTALPVTHVFNSHFHGDHWLGNQAIAEAYPRARFIAHPATIARLKAGAAQQWVDMMLGVSAGFTEGTRAVLPDTPAGDGASFAIGGMTFRVYAPEKAHSGTDIMVEVVEEKVLFGGDNVLSGRIARLDDGTFRGSIAALDRALATRATVIVPGHGPSGGRELLERYRDFLTTLYDEVRRQTLAGRSDYQMKPEVVKKLAAYRGWADFEDGVGRQIGFAVQEAEAE
jgi:glyoxylase-like metal-dependent hydrolase (beta-lactamase superfamily II)